MKTPYSDRFDQATDRLDIKIDGGVVRIDDGEDTWLCTQKGWCEARAQLRQQRPVGGDESWLEAYSDLIRAVPAPILSLRRSDRGSLEVRRELALKARDADLLPESLRPLAVAGAIAAGRMP